MSAVFYVLFCNIVYIVPCHKICESVMKAACVLSVSPVTRTGPCPSVISNRLRFMFILMVSWSVFCKCRTLSCVLFRIVIVCCLVPKSFSVSLVTLIDFNSTSLNMLETLQDRDIVTMEC